MKNSEKLSCDEIIDFLMILQEEADDLVVCNVNCKPSYDKYEIMALICENAWYQAQLRAWIKLERENIRQEILDIDGDVM